MALNHITPDERDALQIVDAFVTAVARGDMYPRAACLLAANELTSPTYRLDPEDQPVIDAFVAYLRRMAEE